jgi:hypothetical protein
LSKILPRRRKKRDLGPQYSSIFQIHPDSHGTPDGQLSDKTVGSGRRQPVAIARKKGVQKRKKERRSLRTSLRVFSVENGKKGNENCHEFKEPNTTLKIMNNDRPLLLSRCTICSANFRFVFCSAICGLPE